MREVLILDPHRGAGDALEALEHVEPTFAPVALERIGSVRDLLELAQDELRDHERALEKSHLAQVHDASVDDHGRVEDLVCLAPPHRLREELGRHVLELVALGEGHRGAQIGEEQAEETRVRGVLRSGETTPMAVPRPSPSPKPTMPPEGAPEDPVDRNTTRLPFEEHGEHAEQKARAGQPPGGSREDRRRGPKASPAAAAAASMKIRTMIMPMVASQCPNRALTASSTVPTPCTSSGCAAPGREIVLRHHRRREAESRRFLEPDGQPRHRAHFPGQSHLAHHHRIPAHRPVEIARGRRHHHPEIRRGLVDAPAARDVDEDVLALERKAHALLEHGEEQANPIVVGPEHGAPRRAEAGRRDEGLKLEEERARALEARHDHGARAPRGRSARKNPDGLGTSASPCSPISNTPISLVDPKRFLTARRSRWE